MTEARKLQAQEKEKRLQEQAKQNRDEFQRIIQAQKEARDSEMRAERERLVKITSHAAEIKKQIATKDESQFQKLRSKYEESKKIKDDQQAELRLLEKIKERKIKELEGMGVPEKYIVDLKKQKIVIG